jgi:hypothetical protein
MSDKKNELLNLIKKTRNMSRSVVKHASKLMGYGQYVSDLADASEDAITCVSSTTVDWQPQIRSWGYLNQHLNEISREIGHINLSLAASSATTVTSCMLDFVELPQFAQFVPVEKRPEAVKASINLNNVIDKLAEKSKALELLAEFGLSTAVTGDKSPADLLETACAAYERPVAECASAATSLIPMRECINSTVAALLRRRPKQEPAKSQSDKILSIARQTAHAGIEDWAIAALADRWEVLNGELSISKKKDISREEWMATLRRSIVLLVEFLQMLDQTKMK